MFLYPKNFVRDYYVDMDGVLANFDKGYFEAFGTHASIHKDDVNWEWVRGRPHFYRDLPLMDDALDLWNYLAPYHPKVLTGVPRSLFEEASANKREWVVKNLGEGVEVICCLSREKCLHAKPGDVLIDDWEKHREKWVKAGGVWITHVSAHQTIQELVTILRS